MIQISKKGLTEDVNNGLKLEQLVSKYGTNTNEMKNLLREAGLKIKKTKVKRFILVDEVINNQEKTTEGLKESYATQNVILTENTID